MSTTTQPEPTPPDRAAAPSPAAEPSSRVSPETPLPGESVLQVPRDTTPTWELEMLVSGAVLYGLFQLPPLIESAWRALLPRLATVFAGWLGDISYLYVKGAIYALTLTFVVHLASRAYWVALVGVDSVFPGGVRWENVRGGPIARATLQSFISPLPRLISRLDNFCSIAFALGFVAASFVLTILVLALGAAGLAWLVSTTLLGGSHLVLVFLILVALVIVPLAVLVVDARLGTRLRADGPLAGIVRRVARANPWTLGLRAHAPLRLTLSTNIPRRIIRPALFLLLMVSFGLAMVQLRGSRKGAPLGVYPGLPASLAAPAGQYRHYADQRTGSDAFVAVPFIQSDMVRDPYVRLFIPYVPARDESELQTCRRARADRAAAATPGSRGGGAPAPNRAGPVPAGQPDAGPAGAGQGGGGAEPRELTAIPTEDEVAIMCLGQMYDVKVNGRRIEGIDYRFYTDASSGLQGLLGYIPVAGLPRGGNVLTVGQPRWPDAPPAEPPPAPSVIPFWL